ncbi:hypothetical protein BN1708_005175, partial [Verticillium longisporum]
SAVAHCVKPPIVSSSPQTQHFGTSSSSPSSPPLLASIIQHTPHNTAFSSLETHPRAHAVMEAALRQSKAMCPFMKNASAAKLRAMSTSTRPAIAASPCGGTMSKLQLYAHRCPVMGKAMNVQTAAQPTARSTVGGPSFVSGLRAMSSQPKAAAAAAATAATTGKAKMHTSSNRDARAVEGNAATYDRRAQLPPNMAAAAAARPGSAAAISDASQAKFNYDAFYNAELEKKHKDKSYRYFNNINRLAKEFPRAHMANKEDRVTVWCANDYLGMGRNPHVLRTMHETLDEYGSGAGGTRNISGHNKHAVELEATVAKLHSKEAALVFSSCYVANDATLATLGSKMPDCVILSDSLNHASMIQGIRHSGTKKIVFKHNDVADLEAKLASLPLHVPKIIAFESVYSMCGSENAESQADSTFAVLDNMILLNNHPRCYFRKLEKEKNMLRVPQGGDTTQDTSITPAFLTKSMKVLNRCRDLNDISLSWKVKVLVAILDECRKLREKVLIFSQSIPTIDWLSTLFRQQQRPYSRLTGDTLPSIRQSMVKNFNEGDNEIFVISTQAGGQGLNITGASRVVIFDFRFNPIAEQQAIGRAYRIGQSKPVVVYRFVSGGTYEQHLYNKAVWKMQLASRVVDKDNPKRWSTKTKDAFTRDYKAPEQKNLTEFLGRDSVLDSVLSSPAFASAIRSIIVTDTFEEEDPNDYHFDAQENQEVELMVRLEQARITDPTQYARLLAEKSAREGAQQMQALGYGHGHANLQQMQTGAPGIIHPSPNGRVVPSNGTMVGRPAPAGVTMSPVGMPYYTTYAGGGSQPASVPRANELESPFGQHGSQSHVQASVYTTARAGTAAASTTLPVMGANTFMSGQEGTTASPAQVRKSTPLQRGSPQAGSSPAVYRGTQAKELFQKQLIRSVQSSSDFDEILQAHDAEGQAKAIAEAVHEQLSGRGALPILSSWKTLNLFAQGQSFAAGVLSGLVTVEFLANTTDDGVFQQRAQELSGMDRSELKEQLLRALRRPHNVHV